MSMLGVVLDPATVIGAVDPRKVFIRVWVSNGKRARTPSDLVHELPRAHFLAESVPIGPTLREIPFQLLMGEGHPEVPAWVSPAPVVATPEQIDRVAEILVGATNPIIITEHGGRTDNDRTALTNIAEALSAPVFEFWNPAYHNFPRSHRLYGAGPVEAVLGEADAVLLAGCNGPWHPPYAGLRPGCAVVHLEQDLLRPRAAYWGYPTTEAVAETSRSIWLRSRPICKRDRHHGPKLWIGGPATRKASAPRASKKPVSCLRRRPISCPPPSCSARCTTHGPRTQSVPMRSRPKCRR
ncbi:hypothetical protein [Mycobacterium sp. URHB0021]|jgi:thiamine pyrophosphate-dependent enzyme